MRDFTFSTLFLDCASLRKAAASSLLSAGLILGLMLGLSAPMAQAQDGAQDGSQDQLQTLAQPQLRVFAGGISDPVLGLSERYGPLAFNAIGVAGRWQRGPLQLSATVAQTDIGGGVADGSAVPHYDLSYGFGAGDWRLGLGKRLRNWSPSAHGSLFLSRNTPAFTAAYLEKTGDSRMDLPLLRALGPWKGEIFVGTTSDVDQPEDALILGMRLQLQPARGLELDFIRLAQWGGAGFDDGLSAFRDVLLGNTNEGPAANANQLAGIGIAYRLPLGQERWRVYGQIAGEDEAGGLPSCLFHMAGVSVDTTLFGAPTSVALETVDTRTETTSSGFCGPNSAYNNTVYSYAHKGQVLGSALDSEGRSIALHVNHSFADLLVDWSLGHYIVNDSSAAGHRLSSQRVDGTVASLRAVKPIANGQIEGILAYQGFALDQIDSYKGLRAGLGLSLNF